MGLLLITDPTVITILILCGLACFFVTMMIYVRRRKALQAKKENSRGAIGPESNISISEASRRVLDTQGQYLEDIGENSLQPTSGVQSSGQTPPLEHSENQQPHISNEQSALPSPAYTESTFRLSTLPSYPGTVRSMSPPAYSDLSRAQSWRTLGEITRPASTRITNFSLVEGQR